MFVSQFIQRLVISSGILTSGTAAGVCNKLAHIRPTIDIFAALALSSSGILVSPNFQCEVLRY